MYALSQVVHPDELVQIAFDSLRERICVLDRDGSIVLTNQAWSQSARENGASPDRCGLRRICVLDRDGSIVLTNQAWSQSARENGASPDRCGLRVNYLRVCRIATGP